MNALRGIFSLAVTIGCFLNWIDIGLIKISGINWGPTMFLLFASLLTSGYAFYNSYNNTNQNTWVYLITGLLGIGICIFAYVFVTEKMGYVDMLLQTKLSEVFLKSIGLGFYLTGLSSILLFFTGFDKSDDNSQAAPEIDTPNYFPTTRIKNETNTSKPAIQEWLQENPGKSINDYFSKYK